MPYFTSQHVTHALSYLPDSTHPALISVLAMLKAKVPLSESPSESFGSTQERGLLAAYFEPAGGPADRPYYVPFGSPKQGRPTSSPASCG